jgi:large subunit ribosomal protein L31
MKKGIHPNYGPCTIKCACGNIVETRASVPTIEVEICNACHPFYTGKKKIVDSTGRVSRFMRRLGKSKKIKKVSKTSSKKLSSRKKASPKKNKALKIKLGQKKHKKTK